MAHMHEQVVLVKITTIKKGDHSECSNSEISAEVLANIEALVGELLGDEPGRVVEVFVDNEQVSK